MSYAKSYTGAINLIHFPIKAGNGKKKLSFKIYQLKW